MIIAFLIFFVVIGIYEYIKYRRRCSREKKVVYLTVKGEIIEHEIINEPYYKAITMFNHMLIDSFMLILTVQDIHENKFKVSIIKSPTYNGIDCDSYWNKENWIGMEVNWRVKKYPKSNIYFFVDNVDDTL